MPDLGVIVTLIIVVFLPDHDPVRYEERMSAARCIAAATEALLTEAQGKGSIRNGGRMRVTCELVMPESVEH